MFWPDARQSREEGKKIFGCNRSTGSRRSSRINHALLLNLRNLISSQKRPTDRGRKTTHDCLSICYRIWRLPGTIEQDGSNQVEH